MGDPKYPRRVWRKPKRPLNYELKMEELKTLGTFGLRTKREYGKRIQNYHVLDIKQDHCLH